VADILGIGASGLSAYRKSLEVTGNNIVNAGTEGYARRTATLASSGERASSPTSISQGGGGVSIDLVRRASDTFLQARMWNAASASGRAQALADGLSRLERGLLTTPSNVNKAVGELMAKMQDLTASPVSMPARFAVIDAAEQVVTQFRTQDSIVASEIASVEANIREGLGQVNVLTAQLAKLNEEFMRGSSGGAANDLLDQRDKLLGELSRLVGVTVTEKSTGVVEVSLGATTSGPRLVEGKKATELAVRTIGERIETIYDPYGSGGATNEMTSGALAGSLNYHRQAVNVRSDLDRLAVAFADLVNRQHRQGIDLSGRSGVDLFSTESLTPKPAAGNKGVTEVLVDVSQAGTLPDLSYTARYDASSRLWTVKSSNNAVTATGRDEVVIDGIRLAFSGSPADGDVFTVSPLENAAQGIRLLTQDPSRLAAALPRYTEVGGSNEGNGDLRIETGSGDTSPPQIARIQDVLTRSLSPSSALGLARNGIVGMIPSGAAGVSLASLGSLSAASFDVTKTTSGNASPSLTFTLSGGAATTLSLDPTTTGAADYAAAVNRALAAATDPDGDAWSESLHASASGDILTINGLGDVEIEAASIDGLESGTVESPAIASDILIFTREGRQLNGSEMTLAERDGLLVEANGFTANATYIAPSLTTGYRGIALDPVFSPVDVVRGDDGINRVTVRTTPETDSVQTDASGVPVAGAVHVLDVAGLPSVRLAGAEVAGLASEAVAAALRSALEAHATQRTVTGAAFTPPSEDTSFGVTVDGLAHTVTFVPNRQADGTLLEGGTFSVDGPMALRFGLDDSPGGGQFLISMTLPPKLDGEAAPEIEFSGTGASALGLSGSLAGTSRGSAAADSSALAAGRALAVELGGTVASITITGTSGSTSTTVTGVGTFTLSWSTDDEGRLRLTSPEDPDFRVVSRDVTERAAAIDLGFLGTDLTVTGSGNEIEIASTLTDPDDATVDGSRSVSRIGNALSLAGPIPEDLIVVMRGDPTDKRALVGRFPENVTRVPPEAPDVEIRVTGTGSIEIFDQDTGVSLAHRSFAEGDVIEYQDLRFSIAGRPVVGDLFRVSKDTSRTGDARNALLLAGLRNTGLLGANSASFEDAYLEATSKLATASQAAGLGATSAERAASDLQSAHEGKTGVNLDEEAADLIRFQQAYQAAAQVVMAARDMFQTILRTF